MVLIRLLLLFALVAASAAAVPTFAHEKQKHAQKAPRQGRVHTPGAVQERMEDHMEAMEDRRPKGFSERLTSWIGRTHPFAVHFPIALFPVALVALFLTRRRGETVELIRALIIVAGVATVVAAVLGWFTGGFLLVDADAVQLWHRWIGTGLALLGGAIALWALRHRASVNSTGMVFALAAITLILLVQGWLGAALVHGMGHMNF
jgi:uncharacterized membrane protein